MDPHVRRAASATKIAALAARAAVAMSALLAVACQEQPSVLCDRVRIVWPYFEIDPRLDVSEAEGLQVDLHLRTTLNEGSAARLTVQGETGDPVLHPEESVAGEDGALDFHGVTMPLGRLLLEVAIENECGESASRRQLYAWDGLGFPQCELSLGVEPTQDDAYAPLGVLRASDDGDPVAPGLQLHVTVDAGRPDMSVTLFALDVASGEQEIVSQESGTDRIAAFDLTIGEGEQAIRAVCEWEPEELLPSSVTERLWVDTDGPACELVEPDARIRQADDLDPDQPGVQFELVGRATGADVAGEAALFTVNGVELDGSPVSAEGESSVTATLELEGGAPQELGFSTQDHAGNPCGASVVF
jgi:hypothetical protein